MKKDFLPMLEKAKEKFVSKLMIATGNAQGKAIKSHYLVLGFSPLDPRSKGYSRFFFTMEVYNFRENGIRYVMIAEEEMLTFLKHDSFTKHSGTPWSYEII